jgi:hypothetical protein
MGTSLEQAIRSLGITEADEQEASDLPWFTETAMQGE